MIRTAASDLAAACGALASVINPTALGQARLHAVDSSGNPLRPPILDMEPWRVDSFYDSAPFGIRIPPNPTVTAITARIDGAHRVVEIGCGAGRNARALAAATSNLVVLDQSRRSLERVAAADALRGVRGSALALPFVDEAFDFTVCDGVAHHTGDTTRGIAEAVRVTRHGGMLYLSVYRTGSLYEALYRTVGGLLRTAKRMGPVGVAVDVPAFGFYRVASAVLKRGRTTDREALRSIYEDYFLTPIATFHTQDEMRALLDRLGCKPELIERQGNIWSMIAKRS